MGSGLGGESRGGICDIVVSLLRGAARRRVVNWGGRGGERYVRCVWRECIVGFKRGCYPETNTCMSGCVVDAKLVVYLPVR